MAGVEYFSPIKGLHGKLCKHDDVIFKRLSSSGKNFTSKVCTVSGKPASELQLAARDKFSKASDKMKSIWSSDEQLAPYKRDYEQGRKSKSFKYHTFRGYLFARMMKEID